MSVAVSEQRKISVLHAYPWPAVTRRRLAHRLAADKPVTIEGVGNVWCCSASVGNRSALVNIVATAES